MKKRFWVVVKFVVPLVIIGWLLSTIDPQQWRELTERPKDWPRLCGAFALVLTAVCITFARWYLLVRALELPFRLRDAFRLGFLGYLMNFVSVGAVGGDLFKAVFIAREQPGRRTEAVATVVVDRLFGLFGLLVVTTVALLLIDLPQPTPEVRTVCNLTYLFTGLGALGLLAVLTPGFTSSALSEVVSAIPKVGPVLDRLMLAVRMYRTRPLLLLFSLATSCVVHSLMAVSLYLSAGALFTQPPSLAEHFIIIPLSLVAGALPFTPAGLGAMELAMQQLYKWIPAAGTANVSGVTIALVYRLMTIGVAMIGVVFYWTNRSEVVDVMHEVEREQSGQKLADRAADAEAGHSAALGPSKS